MGMGVGITLLGIPVYYLCVVWQTKPVWFQISLSKPRKLCTYLNHLYEQPHVFFSEHITHTIQKLFVSAKEEKAEDVWE